jgi:hypothetical protein
LYLVIVIIERTDLLMFGLESKILVHVLLYWGIISIELSLDLEKSKKFYCKKNIHTCLWPKKKKKKKIYNLDLIIKPSPIVDYPPEGLLYGTGIDRLLFNVLQVIFSYIIQGDILRRAWQGTSISHKLQWSLSKPNLIGINFCGRNRHIFGLYRYY